MGETASANARTGLLLAAPALILLFLFYLFPVGRVLSLSVLEPTPGLGNYEMLFTSSGIQRVLTVTARICLITTAIAVPLGYLMAYVITIGSRGMRTFMLYGVLLPSGSLPWSAPSSGSRCCSAGVSSTSSCSRRGPSTSRSP